MRRSACPLAVLLLLALSLGVWADEAEIWRFSDGTVERSIDVTKMPAFVRAALVDRLAAQGFTRLEEEAPDTRDLEADVEALVRNDGRFPAGHGPAPRRVPHAWPGAFGDVARLLRLREAAPPGTAEARVYGAMVEDLASRLASFRADWASRAGDLPPEARRGIRAWLRPEPETGASAPTPGSGASAPTPGSGASAPTPAVRILGAPVSLEGGGWRLASVPPGSMAAALDLRPGDRIVSLDGRPPARDTSVRWATAPARGGKLTLLVRRREGRTSNLALEFVPAAVE